MPGVKGSVGFYYMLLSNVLVHRHASINQHHTDLGTAPHHDTTVPVLSINESKMISDDGTIGGKTNPTPTPSTPCYAMF